MASSDSASEDIESHKRQLATERSARAVAEARAEAAARATSGEVPMAHLRVAIEKLKRDLYGSPRGTSPEIGS